LKNQYKPNEIFAKEESFDTIEKMISFEEFQKLDLRTAKILKAEKVENSDKLFRLEVDLGDEKRQLVAGLGQFYKPRELIGRAVVVVANLEPKVILGLESRGMLLAADVGGEPVLVVPEKEAPPGSKVR